MGQQHHAFIGAKLALFVGDRLLTLHRDDRPDISWPGFWDLPGGGVEAGESPLGCALRETQEEFTLKVPPAQVTWGRAYTNSVGTFVWFFAGWMPQSAVSDIALGDEGQGWDLMTIETFLAHSKVVPQFKSRLNDYLSGAEGEAFQKDPPQK